MLHVLAVVVGLIALGIAVITFVRGRSVRAALQDAHRRLYLAHARLNELEDTMQKELTSLRAEVRWRSGATVFHPQMKLSDAIAIDARVRDVFSHFHIGGCSACAVDEEQSIEQVATSYGLTIEQLMAALTGLSNGQEPLQTAHGSRGLLQLEVF